MNSTNVSTYTEAMRVATLAGRAYLLAASARTFDRLLARAAEARRLLAA